MTNVKVTLSAKNGNEYEALVPITKACEALFDTRTISDISKMSYSAVQKCHNYLLGKARNASQRAQLNQEISDLFSAMKCSNEIVLTNCVLLYKD